MIYSINNNFFLAHILKHKIGRRFIHKVTNKRFVLKEVNKLKLTLDLLDNWGVSKYILKHGNYDPFASNLVKNLIRPNSTVIDIGANIGYWSNMLASLDKTLKVISFEPEPSNLVLLEENIKLNHFNHQITIIPKALSNEKGTFKLYLSKDNFGDHRLYDDKGNRKSIEIEATIADDEILDENISFIKIDVQGYEYKVISGMQKILEKNKDISILTEFWPYGIKKAGDNPEDYLDLFYQLGFKSYIVNDTVTLINKQEIMQHAIGEKHIDLLFVNQLKNLNMN